MLNDSQFERLAAYEKFMKTAIDSNYPRSPGPRALREIHAVLREVDPLTPTLNTTCGTCILRLLKKAGRLYFDRKAANDKAAADATKEEAAKPAPPENVPPIPARGETTVPAKPKKAPAKKGTTNPAEK